MSAQASARSRGPRGRKADDDPTVRISKAMSYLLRHGAAKEGLPIREDGFMLVQDLLSHPRLKAQTFATIQSIVATNDKQRFTLHQDPDTQRWYVRANQGHSMNLAVDMTPIMDAKECPVAVHGTYSRFWLSIAREGLKVMSRQHIHFAVGRPGEDGVISGMRSSTDILIYIDVEKALADNIPFYRSSNNVILSPGKDGVIHPKYFSRVEDRAGRTLS
ncbi:tRNA 2'-phosphotransferase 1 [Gaertneriomyces sp. JEL0708]|nr:tRNA 2'-phosphotransferase 1 [Gaertneriomyces sp. JEL0708]